ncbi:DNA-binding protein [Mitsuokella multacida]|uniref:DNA-binding protein n=1 Tax=Mitsuokella multacida TaxID=52226 RepID=UPI0024202E02|nr:DNA-binding protein [Mitsuokella multacida]
MEQDSKKQEPLSRFIGAKEVAADTGCSVGFAYSIIKKVNDKLEAKGYIIPRHGHTLRRAYYEMTGGE